MTFDVAHGDITEQRVDAIVNAANSSLLGGGGVDGAIHRMGGPEILAACRALRAGDLRDGLATGDAVATVAGRLPARWVIHTVGPVHATSEDRSLLLRSCYRRSLEIATELGAGSVAFPLISAGLYRWPVEDAIRIAAGECWPASGRVDIRLVLYGRHEFDLAEQIVRGHDF
ncbi:MAG TPA: O-acetyl-ADP-ribose deacetylase [Micromonosporaceae bacterium]|nr:O-acetyl-ADP-ribose deacetylase [Micromonosporaceae bacterium]